MWSTARQQGRAASNSAVAGTSSRLDSGAASWARYLQDKAKYYNVNAEPRKCFFCGKAKKLSSGSLPIVGAIWKCANCKAKYQDART